jgi:ribosomal-protein-alanine N-acetyltransferase
VARLQELERAVQQGERVFLRRPTASDEREYFQLRRVSASFLRPWEPAGREDPRGQRDAFQRMLRSNRTGHHEKLLVCLLEDGTIVGYIAVNEIVRGAFQSGYLAYWVGSRHAGQGYMTEALQLALRHAFGSLGLHRVEANIIPGNRPSLRLVKRAGFRKEGLSRRYLNIAGRWQDHERWALLAEDFSPKLG